jgi:hypothetical protein
VKVYALRNNMTLEVRGLAFFAGALLLAGTLMPAPAALPQEAPLATSLPFAVGEKLVFRVEWNPPWYLFFLPSMEAGEATLSLAGETRYQDKKALKIVFTARSSGMLVKLAGVKVDDYYEFTTDPETFCTFSVAKKIREGKRMRDIDLVYLPETRQMHMREVDVAVSPSKVLSDKDYENIPPCVKDLFSALYAVRRTKLEAGATYRVVAGDNQYVKEVEVHVEKSERVLTPKGRYSTWQVNTVAVLGGLFKDGGQFRMWLSADERKMPVKFEAKVYLGKVTGSLKEVSF